jgi:hypothetical protein
MIGVSVKDGKLVGNIEGVFIGKRVVVGEVTGNRDGLDCLLTGGEANEQATKNIREKSNEIFFIDSNWKVSAQRQALPARAGCGGKSHQTPNPPLGQTP